ncbi:MAG: hypothetical protein IT380_18920 [Myxococcales bacterium]|nr:hypothetical protein [Myxococcales bacterium]
MLMVLALFAFAWMWFQTHRRAAPGPPARTAGEAPALSATPVDLVPAPAGGDR